MNLRGMPLFRFFWDASVKRQKAINNDVIAPAHAQSVVLLSKHYLLKDLIQLLRNVEDHIISYFTPYFAFFLTVQSIL